VNSEPLERRRLLRIRAEATREDDDWVVVEEPLEIRVAGDPLAVVMRTPGHDVELAAGFALTEGIVRSFADLGTIRHCNDVAQEGDAGDGGEADQGGGDGREAANVIDIGLAPGVEFDREEMRRYLPVSAACGLCGRASIESLSRRARPNQNDLRVPRSIIASLPDRLSAEQGVFRRTGALHAAALFDAAGRLLAVREDVGRHNAVDKVIGRTLLHGLDPSAAILLVSGRTSFEILQKAAVAGVPIVCAVSGPTTLAIDTARAFRITLVNFVRPGGMNIASCPERLTEA
jgi:FdhD protein